MLDLACFQGHEDCVETLLYHGAQILVQDNVNRRTPLHASGESHVIEMWYQILIFFEKLILH